MANEQKKKAGPLWPVVGEEWPDGLEVIEETKYREPNDHKQFFTVLPSRRR